MPANYISTLTSARMDHQHHLISLHHEARVTEKKSTHLKRGRKSASGIAAPEIGKLEEEREREYYTARRV